MKLKKENKYNTVRRNSSKKEQSVFSSKRNILIALTIIILISIIAYFPVFHNNLLDWDDEGYIKNNPMIHSFDLRAIFSKYVMGNYHPVTMLFYSLEYHLFGLNPAGYHAVNLLLHLIIVLLVFYTVFLLSENTIVALAASFLFGIHPLHVESVAWAAELKDLLYTLFFLASYIFYLKYLKEQRSKYYFIAISLFLISLLSKAMAASLPLVLILTDYFKGRKINTRALVEKVPFFILALILGIVAVYAQKSTDSILNDNVITFPQRIMFASYGFLSYLIKLLLPFNLCSFYPYPVENGVIQVPPLFYLYFIISLGLVFFTIYSLRFSKKIIFGLGFFTLTVLMVLQLLPVGKAIMADRYAYIPSIGIFYLAGEGILYLWNKNMKMTGVLFLGIAAVFLPIKTYARCGIWKNEMIFWSDVIDQYQTVDDAYYNRGIIYMNENKTREAVDDFDKAIALKPYHSNAYNNKGLALMNANMGAEALIQFNMSIEKKPDNADAYYNRGTLFLREQKDAEAIRDYNKAIELKPDYAEAYNNRGSVFVKMKRNEDALKDFNKALELNPHNAEAYYNMGVLYMNEKKNGEAIGLFDKAIGLKAGYANAYNNRAIVYAEEKKLNEAIADLTRVIELQPDNANAYNNRGMVYTTGKRDTEAMNDFNSAIQLNPKFAGAHYNLANLLFEAKKYPEAIGSYNNVIALMNNYAQAWYKKGLAEYYSGQQSSACLDLKQALNLGSNLAAEAISHICK